jgi:hypothetical protein
MPNYNKPFNFRSGVQVDYDNFVVNSNGLVGIGTTTPELYLFNVYGDARVTGLTTTKDLNVSSVATVGFLTVSQGIRVSSAVTATAFYGDGSTLSNIVGFSTNSWILNITQTGLSTSLNIGIGTQALDAYDLVIGDDPLVSEGISFVGSTGNVYSSGIVTATSFSGSGAGLTALSASQLTGIIDNARLPSNINVSGIITALSGFVGNLTGIASTAHSITTTANITVNSINSGFSTTGISTVFTTSHVGTGGTAFAALNSGRIGVGTALPTSELQIRKASGSLLEVISDTGSSRISIGQSVGVGKSTAVLRFGNQSKTFDIINNDTGNINTILHAGVSGVGTGRFDWLYGQNLGITLMSLTYDGKLGVGLTDPINTIHVSGSSTVTGNSYVGQNLYVNGSITADSYNLPPVLIANINSSSGISTFANINVQNIGINSASPAATIDCKSGSGLFAGIGINTNAIPSVSFQVHDGVSLFDRVGVGTTSLKVESFGTPRFQSFNDLFLYDSILNVDNSVNSGIVFGYSGTANLKAAIDFSNVGSTNGTIGTIRGYMLPPFLSNTTRNGIGGTEPGAIIWNTTTKKHQGYGSTNGGTTYEWQDLY